jgi:hypothetical protein
MREYRNRLAFLRTREDQRRRGSTAGGFAA